MGNTTDERWLSRQELADRLGLPVKTLAQWASKGTGPRYARMGRHVRYRLSDVLEWEFAQVEVRREAEPVTATEHDCEEPSPSRDADTGGAGRSVRDDPHHL
jgi:excisionase family DNA binding protein